MKNLVYIVLFVSSMVLLNSCNKNLDKVLFGTWNVTKVEGTLNSGNNPIFTAEDNNPTGIVKFNTNGRGEQNYSFTFASTVYTQQGDFSWEANDDEIIINRVSEPDLIWVRVEDTENRQVATYNVVVDANQNWDYTLTLEK